MNSFYFDKMHMLYIQNISYVKSCQKHCFKTQKQTLFTPKTHCFPKKPIVFQHVHILSHCFETKNYHWGVGGYRSHSCCRGPLSCWYVCIYSKVCAANSFPISYAIGIKLDMCKFHELRCARHFLHTDWFKHYRVMPLLLFFN